MPEWTLDEIYIPATSKLVHIHVARFGIGCEDVNLLNFHKRHILINFGARTRYKHFTKTAMGGKNFTAREINPFMGTLIFL